MHDIQEAWSRIERWLEANAPEVLAQLLGPATPGAIARVEDKLKLSLPEEFRASLLRHAGEKHHARGVMGGYVLRTVDEMMTSRETVQDLRRTGGFPADADANVRPGPGVRQSWIHELWLPIAEDGPRDIICLDMAPAEGGLVGQLVRYVGDMRVREVVSPSFGAWLTQRADDMQAGRVFAKRNESTGKLIGLRYVGDVDDD